MLVIISDLHLTDGSSGATIAPGAFQIFAERLADLAFGASWRADGSYQPLERVDLVLLGDVLDVIRSGRWAQQDGIRPWDNPHEPDVVDLVTKITSDILRHNDQALAVLRGLASDHAITLPPATNHGRPDLEADSVDVPVHIHYMVGNHDWFFHVAGAQYDLLRQALVRGLGLTNRFDQPFPHDPAECEQLLEVMRRHRVLARHGDTYDPINFEGDRDASSLGDAIVIELLSRFSSAVENQLGDDLPVQTIAGLREIDNVRPLLLVPVWIDGLLERTCSFPSQRKKVKLVWDDLADRFLELPFVRDRDTWNPADLVDGLQRTLKFSKHLSIGWASDILNWIHEFHGPVEGSYHRHALREPDFRNRRARHIVYGHTHHAETIPLDASHAEGFVLNQHYFNSGTWRRVYRQTRLDPSEHEFIPADVMTYLAFFQGDERGGRPFETWTGTLGIQPCTQAQHRIDVGRSSHAAGQSLSPSALHGHRPHFRSSSAPTGSLDQPAG